MAVKRTKGFTSSWDDEDSWEEQETSPPLSKKSIKHEPAPAPKKPVKRKVKPVEHEPALSPKKPVKRKKRTVRQRGAETRSYRIPKEVVRQLDKLAGKIMTARHSAVLLCLKYAIFHYEGGKFQRIFERLPLLDEPRKTTSPYTVRLGELGSTIDAISQTSARTAHQTAILMMRFALSDLEKSKWDISILYCD